MEVHEPPSSYTAYAALPAEAPRYEIIQGVACLTPAPGSRHQRIIGNLHLKLESYLASCGERPGWLYLSPYDVVLTEHDVVQPDLVYISTERRKIIRARGVFGAPDWVIEVVSPSTADLDRGQKHDLYARHGVREYWIIDPENRSVNRWTDGERPLGRGESITAQGLVQSAVLPEFRVSLADIFAGLEDIPED